MMNAIAGGEGRGSSAKGVNCEESVRLRHLSKTDRRRSVLLAMTHMTGQKTRPPLVNLSWPGTIGCCSDVCVYMTRIGNPK